MQYALQSMRIDDTVRGSKEVSEDHKYNHTTNATRENRSTMAHNGGNQRELARERNLKKQAQMKKGHSKDAQEVKLENRMERDADIMRKKQQAAQAKKAAENAANGSSNSKVQNYDPLK
ncbi:hypothetical protein Tcan_03725 [Toxocara canis]|uniref:Small EDRK-rich factor-like N-terminal domain-containing protein n=1 Tax=Toxocara canis TaxID=6265 RepID=A0A0B2V0P3_TOXCA|nr:hypothetical protein Tcan_03725 [Toxocara canis]